MLVQQECFSCILRLMRGVAEVSLSPQQVDLLLTGLDSLPPFARGRYSGTPAHLVSEVWPRVVELSGHADPLHEVRKRQNALVLAALDGLRERAKAAADPLAWALRAAAAGNKLDAMAAVDRLEIGDLIEVVEREGPDDGALEQLRQRLDRARSVLWFGDNCGEIVLDRLLMEVLTEQAPRDITYVTRALPMANDALVEDALDAGIGELAQVIANGIERPFPGTDLRWVSPRVSGLAETADLVISKGLANYETLDEEPSLAGRISFLLEAKCAPICRVQGVGLGALIISNR
jgi:damage-control phosphatase, subfamily I